VILKPREGRGQSLRWAAGGGGGRDYAKFPIRTARSRRYSVVPSAILTSVGLPAHHQHKKSRSFSALRKYRGDEKSLARPGRKQANVSVKMA